MKLYKFLEQLQSLTSNLDIEIMMDTGRGTRAHELTVETVFEDGHVTGLIIMQDKQMKLPFDMEPK